MSSSSLSSTGIVIMQSWFARPHVSYELTTMGVTLREAAAPLLEWSIAHLGEIDAARSAYDDRTAPHVTRAPTSEP